MSTLDRKKYTSENIARTDSKKGGHTSWDCLFHAPNFDGADADGSQVFHGGFPSIAAIFVGFPPIADRNRREGLPRPLAGEEIFVDG